LLKEDIGIHLTFGIPYKKFVLREVLFKLIEDEKENTISWDVQAAHLKTLLLLGIEVTIHLCSLK
jgi:hypothetical protein